MIVHWFRGNTCITRYFFTTLRMPADMRGGGALRRVPTWYARIPALFIGAGATPEAVRAHAHACRVPAGVTRARESAPYGLRQRLGTARTARPMAGQFARG